MATQAERQDYKWRPNDNSIQTNLRYDLEAEKWSKAFKSAQRKQQSVSFSESVSVIGMVISLIASLVVLVVMGIIDFYKWLTK